MTQPAPDSRHTVDEDLAWTREQLLTAQQETTDAVTRAERAEADRDEARADRECVDRLRKAPLDGRNAAVRRAEQAEAALDAVRALHQRQPEADYCDLCSNHGDITWPCATVRALDAHTNPTDQPGT